VGGDDGPAFVAVLRDDLAEFRRDDRALPRVRSEDVVEVRDLRLEGGVVILDLLPLECGEAPELKVEDGIRLNLWRRSRASSTVAAARISAITASRASSALR
jgi:hypothetical protein